MTTPSRIVFQAAGSHAVEGCSYSTPGTERCALCGHPSLRGTPYAKWQGTAFASQNQLACPGSSWICEPCVWSCSWVAPPGFVAAPTVKVKDKRTGEMVEKERTRVPRLTAFSHLWSESDGYWHATGADREKIRGWLRAPKSGAWFAAIADSGKKHVLPFTPLNPAGSVAQWARIDDDLVRIGSWDLVDAMSALLVVSTRAGIESGQHSGYAWRTAPEQVRDFERAWSPLRGSAWFRLALWLATKPEQKEEACPPPESGSSLPMQSSASESASGATSRTTQLSLL